MSPLLDVEDLSVRFNLGEGGLLRKTRGTIHAVSDVSLHLERGECLGLVGESGSGKSTLGRAILQMTRPSDGRVYLDGHELTKLPERQLRPYRRRMQMVFQDPMDAMNPRMTVEQVIVEPLRLQGIGDRRDRRARAAELMETMGLPVSGLQRYPGQFSGGQRQRIAIARALAPQPDLLVLDEPTSGLDVSMQARILNLLADIRQSLGLSYVFISHDLGAVGYLAQRIAVLYLGRVVELAPARTLLAAPRHPYTASLLEALPRLDRKAEDDYAPARGEPPSPVNPPSGCAFHPRCPAAQAVCANERPALSAAGSTHRVACHFPLAQESAA
ncbi:peptide ABC transporter ATP-binding protein [Acidihalobacter aeolianus]|uniref:Peptide ABC transporter ATP-binding protein n=1 Tax=Acidihalobacter aeolianus TaxID=2792603 RepID=A0A1D8K9P1_9GAMM|nr:ABC transporter ATP-binding protein [Acidihalobacter aeolianus]AOV17672.1 peptide ABC transporter ATP-binding protein [Acidihalobacter aeolianus]